MDLASLLLLSAAVFAGAFISGLAGFAFSAVAGAILLHVFQPLEAVPLMMACSVAVQATNLLALRRLVQWKGSLVLIVGGLLGGLIGVELAKKIIGWTRSTGDDFALPLIVGMMIGRIGCFLTGLDDHTYGTPTTWITGVDFGDGILRHPTQLYEIAFLFILGVLLFYLKRQRLPEGTVFQLFMIGYLVFRLLIDFIKPTPHPYLIFNNVQMAAILGLIYYSRFVRRWRKETEPAEENAHA